MNKLKTTSIALAALITAALQTTGVLVNEKVKIPGEIPFVKTNIN